ncbi:MAG: adenylate/guanylate cyclase domain-containing protein [Bacteroidota bacterium]
MLSPKTKRHLLQIIPFGLGPLVFSITYSLLEKGILGDETTYPSTSNPYQFSLFTPAILSLLAGLLFGALEVFYLNKLYQKTSLFRKVLLKTGIYFSGLVITTMGILIVINLLQSDLSLSDKQLWIQAGNFFNKLSFWSLILYFTIALSLPAFYNEVSDNIGQGVLLNFLTGKYHQPIEEERIFMFLDMRSSTTIAEKLGHVQYFNMLKAYYADLSDPIVQFGGEIYQYVGDEVIVSWKLKTAEKNLDCLHCFFAMQASLQEQTQKYQETFGVVPTFKAGIHLGEVTTGEIGVIKKDITFSGDVLNTTARIQGLCNQYKVDLLVSDQLMDVLELGDGLSAKALGEVELRGRHERVHVFTVDKRN